MQETEYTETSVAVHKTTNLVYSVLDKRSDDTVRCQQVWGRCKRNINCTKHHPGLPHEACEDCTPSDIVTFESKDLDMSKKFLQIGKTYTKWTFTDGKTMFTRTNPWHTHQGRYQLGTLQGFGDPEFPDFITNAFGEKNLQRAHLINNADEGETGYIHLPPSMQEQFDLIKGKDKSGRSFISFRVNTKKGQKKGHGVFQQRYASYLDTDKTPQHKDFWVWHGFESKALHAAMNGSHTLLSSKAEQLFDIMRSLLQNLYRRAGKGRSMTACHPSYRSTPLESTRRRRSQEKFHKRPRGRPPKGKTFNAATGQYE